MERLIGKRIVLRKAAMRDLDAIYTNVYGDAALLDTMFLNITENRADAEARLRRTIAFQQDKPMFFASQRDTDEAIGLGGVRKEAPGVWSEAGIAVARKAQGKGYGAEILALLLEYAFIDRGAEQFVYYCMAHNARSRALAERFGFRYDSERDETRERDGQTFRVVRLTLSRAEYLALCPPRSLTRVYLVRHAQPDFSHEEDRTRPLTDEGRADARIVLDTLREHGVDAVYCSPYLRSMDTVRETAAHFGLPIRTDERLREREAGPGGNVYGMFRRRWKEQEWHEPGGESIAMVRQRNTEALRAILTKEAGRHIVIGTHGTAMSSLISGFVPAFGCDDFLRIIDWMPCVTELVFDGQELTAIHELAHVLKEYKAPRP